MNPPSKLLLLASLILTLSLSPSCWFSSADVPNLEIGLYSGVNGIIQMDDTEADVLQRSAWTCSKEAISDGSLLGELKFTQVCNYKELGIRASYRFGRIALLEIQEPFHGVIRGKNMTLFTLNRIEGKTWRDTLIQRFGAPATESTGGRLSSQALFYDWGDISFNGQGPNEIALYRDIAIRQYRVENFGRILDLGFH